MDFQPDSLANIGSIDLGATIIRAKLVRHTLVTLPKVNPFQ